MVWRKSSAMRAALPFSAAVRCAHIHIRDVDDAGFLLMLCVHSPGATRVLLANKIIVPFLRPMTMETRCSKVIFPNYSKKEPAEDTLVPPLWGTRGFFFFFCRIICSRCCTRRNLRFHVENSQHAESITAHATIGLRSRHRRNPRPTRFVSGKAGECR